MANTGPATIIDNVRARAGRSTDTTLITEQFVLDALNKSQKEIARRIPRHVDKDKKDTTTHRLSSSKTVEIGGLARSSNVVTATTTAVHYYVAGQEVNLADVDSGSETNAFAGVFTIINVPSTTTYTYAQTGADESNLAEGSSVSFSFPTSTLDAAHIGNIWILNGGSTNQNEIKYMPLMQFRNRYIPITSGGASEPWIFTRQGNQIYFNTLIGGDFNGLFLHIDYTAKATDLANDTTVSEYADSDEVLTHFALATCFDAMAVSEPTFLVNAIKSWSDYEKWLLAMLDDNDMKIEGLYGDLDGDNFYCD